MALATAQFGARASLHLVIRIIQTLPGNNEKTTVIITNYSRYAIIQYCINESSTILMYLLWRFVVIHPRGIWTAHPAIQKGRKCPFPTHSLKWKYRGNEHEGFAAYGLHEKLLEEHETSEAARLVDSVRSEQHAGADSHAACGNVLGAVEAY